jgi:hypothetical protein
MFRVAPAALMASVLLASGCSKPTSTVGGKITYQRRPVTSGVIFFLGSEPKLQMGMGTIRGDGTYVATDIPVGEVRVALRAPDVPAKYGDPLQSGLTYTITSSLTSLDVSFP